MEIYRQGSRLFMIMETEEGFSFERKAEMDRNNKKVQEWEELMWQFQEAVPGSAKGEKWMLMEKIFDFK
jgi:L-rhamnose mutarotase